MGEQTPEQNDKESLKNVTDILNIKLKGVLNSYNNIVHRATGISPNKGIKPENIIILRERAQKYKRNLRIENMDARNQMLVIVF